MALLWFDGAEGYETYTDLAKGGYFGGSVDSSTLATSFGRTGSQSIYNPYSKSVYLSLPKTSNNIYILGFAVYIDTSTNASLLAFNSGASTECTLSAGGGYMKLFKGNGTTLLATSTIPINIDAWYYCELKFEISDSTTIDCVYKQDGVTGFTLSSGADTQQSASLYRMVLGFVYSSFGGAAWFDDMYLCDNTGSTNNDFLGPVRVDTLWPNGTGNSSDWDGSDGNQVDNYDLVNDLAPGATYLEAQNTNEKDLFTYDNLTLSADSIYGVKVTSEVEKTTTGPRTLEHVCRSGSTDYDSDSFAAPEDAIFQNSIWEEDPDTSTAWTATGVNAVELGIKVET